MSVSKHMKRNAVTAWSPIPDHAHLLACGTAAGSIGDFSASAALLEVMSISSSDPQDRTMPVVGTAEASERFHCLAWGKGDPTTSPYGLIAGGMANGTVTVFNAAAIVKGDKAGALLSMTEKHTGPVQGLDFNTNQPNLLASGGAGSEVYIWDVSAPSTPKNYSPGAKVQQQTDITCVQWNPKVPYILGTAAYNGVSVVWDLRAKRPVITFSDPSRKSKCRALAWNPIEPMQIVTASEEDTSPVIQVWDLRNTYSPTNYLEGHTKGIWSLSWCPVDPGLLLSCGKHTEIFCWNMQTGKIQCEVETTNSWNANVQWAPHIPAIFSVCSLEGQVKVFNLQDPTPRIMGGGSTKHVDFSHPPKWLKKPVGASFGFGGKLFSFNQKTGPNINVRTLVTDPEFVARAERLETAISGGDFKGFCDEKANQATNAADKQMWNLMKVLFENDSRSKLLAELNFDPEAIQKHIAEALASMPDQATVAKEEAKQLSPPASKDKETEKEKETETEKEEVRDSVPDTMFGGEEEKTDGSEGAPQEDAIPFGDAGKGGDVADLFGGFGGSSAVSFPVGAATEGEGDLFANLGAQSENDPFAAIAASQQQKTSEPAFGQPLGQEERRELAQRLVDPISFESTSDDTQTLITRAVIVGNFSLAVDICIKSGKMADALVLSACGGPDLWAKTQNFYFNLNRAPYMRLISSIVKDNLQDLVAQTQLKSWKGTLAVLCKYAKGVEFAVLCDFLGNRLEEAGDLESAILCYMCAGNVEKTVSAWANRAKVDHKQGEASGHALVELLEKVSVFRKAIDYNGMTDVLAYEYGQYAEALAAQGRLSAAMRYLSFLTDPKYNDLSGRGGAVLLDRVYHALGAADIPAPPAPFAVHDVSADQRLLYQKQQQQHTFPQTNQPEPARGVPVQNYGVGGQAPHYGGVGGQTQFGGAGPQYGAVGGGQPSHLGGGVSVGGGGQPSHLGGGVSVGGQPSRMGGQPASHLGGGVSAMGGGQPSHLGGGISMGGQPASHLGGGASMGGQPASHLGGGVSTMGGQPASHLGGGVSAMGGGQPSHFGGGVSTMGGQPASHLGGGQPSHLGGGVSVLGGPSFGGAAPVPSGPYGSVGHQSTTGGAPGPVAPGSAGSVPVRTPPGSLERPAPASSSSASTIPSNTHLKPKEDRPAGTGQASALGATILGKFASVIDSFSVQFAADPRKSKAVIDAKGKLEVLFGKVRNGELSNGAETLLLDLANALERGDKVAARDIHKKAAETHWEEISNAGMVGLKALMNTL